MASCVGAGALAQPGETSGSARHLLSPPSTMPREIINIQVTDLWFQHVSDTEPSAATS